MLVDMPRVSTHVTNEQIINAATGRFGEVANEIKFAEPYVLTKPDGKTIVVLPLTRRRRKKLKAAQAAYLLSAAQLASVVNDDTGSQEMVDKIERLTEEAERMYDDALFGDVSQEVYDYFDPLPEEFWDAFYTDIHNALVNRIQLPEDVCSKCGQSLKGDDDAGEGDSSSTSSTDSGTTSTETSGTTSA